MAKRNQRANRSRSKRKMGVRRRGRRRRLTPRHQYIRLVLPSTPAVNAGPRQRARPQDVSAARPLAPVCHVDVWGGVPTSRPRPDGMRSGTRREQRGRGSASDGRGERRRNDHRRFGHHRHNQGGRQRRGQRATGNSSPLHRGRPEAQHGEERTTSLRQ